MVPWGHGVHGWHVHPLNCIALPDARINCANHQTMGHLVMILVTLIARGPDGRTLHLLLNNSHWCLRQLPHEIIVWSSALFSID